jgi:hypothetical protein
MVAAGLGLVAVIGVAVVGALFATGEISGRQISGEVVIVESQLARLDREVHAGLAGASLTPGDGDTGLCLELAAAEDVAPGDPVVVYDAGGVVIGRGALGGAHPETGGHEPSGNVQVCVFRFYIDDIRPTDSVAIEISGTRRATYSASEFKDHRWFVSIPLGS